MTTANFENKAARIEKQQNGPLKVRSAKALEARPRPGLEKGRSIRNHLSWWEDLRLRLRRG